MCGGDADEIVIGEVFIYTDPEGFILGYDHPGRQLGTLLTQEQIEYHAEPLPIDERIPAAQVCSTCQDKMEKEQQEFNDEVERGGVRWTCNECHGSGIIVADDSKGFSQGVRQSMNLPAPATVTVQFNRCEQHASEDDPPDSLQ